VTKINERLNTDYRSRSSSGNRGFPYLIAPSSLGNDSSGFCAAWAGLAQRCSKWRVMKAEAQNIDLPGTRMSDFLQRLSALFSVHDCWLLIHPAQNRHRDSRLRVGLKLVVDLPILVSTQAALYIYWLGPASAAHRIFRVSERKKSPTWNLSRKLLRRWKLRRPPGGPAQIVHRQCR
jgi:hypothetical protein